MAEIGRGAEVWRPVSVRTVEITTGLTPGGGLVADRKLVRESAGRLVARVREVASARAAFERLASDRSVRAVSAQREAMRRWQVAEDRERDERSRLAGLLGVAESDLVVTRDEVLYASDRDAERPRHRRGTIPSGARIYRQADNPWPRSRDDKD